jgi:hypothetical protein
MVTAHQLVLAVHIHMVLAVVVGFPVLLGPAGIRVFLRPLGSLVGPALWHSSEEFFTTIDRF